MNKPDQDGFVFIEARWGKDFFEIQVPDCIGEIVRIYHKQWRGEPNPEQEPVAWIHNFIDGGFTKSRPNDIDRYPDRWAALYKDPTPCPTCEALARTVMMDQTSHDTEPPKKEWVGLTENEISKIWAIIEDQNDIMHEVRKYARAIEAKLKDKNR